MQGQIDQRAHKNRWRSLIFIAISLLVISLDNTILNVALPSISTQLGASASDLQWIVDSYILVFAALLLTLGAVGDRYGRKKLLQIGLVLFGIFSFTAAFSETTGFLIAMRALMGIGGAIIMPATLSIVTATFRDPKERAQAIAIWAATFALGVGIGPVIGGWLIENFSLEIGSRLFTWEAVFLVNVPVVILAVIGDHFFVAESRDEHAPPIDIPGALLSVAGLFALVYAIIEAGIVGWTASNVLMGFGASAVLLGAFGWWEAHTPQPMLPLDFFKNLSFSAANSALALVTFSMFGAIFFMSQYFQTVQGYTALEAGIRLLPMALTLMVSAAMSARISVYLKTKVTVGMGILIAAGGLFTLAQVAAVDAPYSSIVIALMILAAGMGMAMSPATNSIMGSVPVRKAGIGSAMNDTTRQLGGALGVAVLGTIMNSTYLSEVESLAENPMVQNLVTNVPEDTLARIQSLTGEESILDVINSSIQGAHRVTDMMFANAPAEAQSLVGGVTQIITDTANTAFVNGMIDALTIGAGIMAIASVLVFILLPSEIQRPAEEDDAPDTQLDEDSQLAVAFSD